MGLGLHFLAYTESPNLITHIHLIDDSKKNSILKKGNRDRKWKNYGNKIQIKETSWRMETS